MKKIIFLLISVILLTGCSKKVNSFDSFKNIMEDNGYTVNNMEYTYEDALGASIATKDDITINFIKMNSIDSAKSYYEELVSYEESSDYIYTDSGNNYSKFISDSDSYKIIYRISNNIIISTVDSKYKSELNDIINKLD